MNEKHDKKNSFINMIVAFVFFLIVLLTLVWNSTPQKYTIPVGQIANEDIYAPWDMVDLAETDRLREESAEAIQPVYKLDLTVKKELNEKLLQLTSMVNSVALDENMTTEAKIKSVRETTKLNLTDAEYEALITADENVRVQMITHMTTVVNQVLDQTLTTEQLPQKMEELTKYFTGIKTDKELNLIAVKIVGQILVPNMFYDEASTNEKKELERAKVEDVVIRKGAILVSRGEEVTPQQIGILEAYGLLKENKEMNIKLVLSLSIIVILLYGIFSYYINAKYDTINHNSKYVTVILLIQIIVYVLSLGLKGISPYLIPITANIIMVTLLIGPGTAMLLGILNSVLMSYLVGFDIVFIVSALLSSVFCVAYIPEKYSRKNLMITGFGVGAINVAVIISFAMLNNIGLKQAGLNGMYGLINGVLSAVFAIGSMPFFESTFDILTPVRLLEYSNPNQPLMKRLLVEAPGTYYHSILVGNLAETAAEEIGANALLCRIGANFHDIGKLKRPYFFKENQMGMENPHDKIGPALSAKIIVSHVEYGLELAKKYKLPQEVTSIIEQHHGNTLVAYFYYAAKKGADGENTVDENNFRYLQKKPQSKEAALVMIADSVEAYVRSLSQPTKEDVINGVRKIIDGKIQDGQLKECDISFIEIEKIIQAFVSVLTGIFHDRIEYPEDIKEV